MFSRFKRECTELVRYRFVRTQQDCTLTTARYLYDPLGRRTGKVVRETPRDGSPERVSLQDMIGLSG
jgi:hypothetical protein